MFRIVIALEALLATPAFLKAALCAIVIAVTAGFAAAQGLQDNDYYSINQTERGAELLKSVEKYHIGPAESGLRDKRYVAARGDIDFILRAFPNHPKALLLMVQLCTQWKSPVCTDDLPTRFEKAIAVNPSAAGTFIVLGIYQQRVGAVAEAIKSYTHALSLNPDSMNAHYNLGLAYLENKQYDLANAHAQQAYQHGAPLPGLRDKLMKAGRWDPAAAPAPPTPGAPAIADPATVEDGAGKSGPPK
jgi:Flp pilus assembly protein TadD